MVRGKKKIKNSICHCSLVPNNSLSREVLILHSFDFFQAMNELLIVFAASFLFFIIGNFVLKTLGIFAKDPTGRYFILHVFCNGFVTIIHLDDVYHAYAYPTESFRRFETDFYGSIVIFSLHLFHIAFFRPLPWVDWIHHLVMIIVMLPLAVLLNPGNIW